MRFVQKHRQLLLVVILSVVTFLFLLPLIWAFLTSLKLHRDVFTFPPKWIFTPTIENYLYVLRETDYLKFMSNSIVISFSSAAMSVFLGALAAFGLSRFRVKGSKTILMWILSLRMIPPIAIVVPFYLMAIRIGLYDTRSGLAIVLLAINVPIAVWLQMSYIREIPKAIEESAMLEGCSPIGAFFRVVLPLEATGLFATFIMCLIFSWNEFPLTMILTGNVSKTLPVSMLSWDTQRGLQWGNMMAASMMAIAPILIFTALAQKYLVRGLTLGSVVD
ncbi:MAG: carbohydrate ABC transporter permease [Candidatus Atribacteria bacterium]|nr:carbohydrate ABC transporter permease [Candidatus Atribacteria bacterium]